MSSLNERIHSLSEIEIRQAFDDVMEYNKQGSMGETFVRQIRNDYAKELEIDSWDRNCMFTCNEIVLEIAKRHYGYKES